MRIDAQKPIHLVTVLALMAAACGPISPPSVDQTKEDKAPITPNLTVVPEVCSRTIDAEAMRPSLLSRESVTTFPGNIVVNQAGSLADIMVNVPNLNRVNSDPALGLNSPEHLNIIYFFAGSFYNPDAQAQIGAFFEAQRPYLLARYCQEQGVFSGRYLLSALSMTDAQSEVSKANPTLIPASPAWISAVERELAENYILGSRKLIERHLQIPIKELSPDTLEVALSSGSPFRIRPN